MVTVGVSENGRVPIDQRLLARVRDLLGEGVREQRMVGGRSFAIGGLLLCGVRGERLMVRLGAEGAQAALTEPHVSPMRMGDKTVSGFVLIGPDGVAQDAELARWLNRARAFVDSIES